MPYYKNASNFLCNLNRKLQDNLFSPKYYIIKLMIYIQNFMLKKLILIGWLIFK